MSTPVTPSLSEQFEFAGRAQSAWERVDISDRLRCVTKLRHVLASECDSLCEVVGQELGKKPVETLGGEILPWADACLFVEREAYRLLSPKKIPRHQRPLWLWGQSDTLHRRPRGIVGIIGTWNYPLFLNGVQIVQALIAGNAVLWKPSEVAPKVAEATFELFGKAGFPEGLLQMLPATREAGQELTDGPIDHLVFTGSADVGRKIAAHLGERLVSSTLELSGCDAMFVLDDADLPMAARAAWFGAMLNRGQTCLAVRRAFVPNAHRDTFCDLLREQAEGAKPMCLALPGQVQQVHRLVHDALSKGAKLLTQPPTLSEENGTTSFPPTVLVDVQPDMAICQEASFAPVMGILCYDRLEEALQMDAECPYRLGASVFTKDVKRVPLLAEWVQTGSVSVNDVIAPTAHPATPFGGRGASGWGVTQGAEGLLEMTVPQMVSVRSGTFRPHYDLTSAAGAEEQGALLEGLLQSRHAPTFWQRLRGWKRLLGALTSLRS